MLRIWDKQPHVIAARNDDGDAGDWAWETELPRRVPWREFLIAEEDGRPIGFMQIIDPREEEWRYWGDCAENLRAIDIWLGEARDLGRGLGTTMMRMACRRCFANPVVTAILIDPLASNTDAHRFYERLGFKAVGPRSFADDDCIVYQLTRQDWRQGV